MPKKKKGAGNKGGKKLLQQRVQAEQEMFLKDKLQREERYTAVNRPRVMEDWRTTLRQTKLAELRREAEVIRQTSEREHDDLDGVIQKLKRELLGVEHQTAQVQSNHQQYLDRLRTQQERDASWLTERWERALEEQRSRHDVEKKRMSVFTALSEERNKKCAERLKLAKLDSADMMEDHWSRHKNRMAYLESRISSDSEDESEELQDILRRSKGGLRLPRTYIGVPDGPHALLTSSRHQTTRRQILPPIQQKRSSAPKPPRISKNPVSFPPL